jgi:MscS family membrane protein
MEHMQRVLENWFIHRFDWQAVAIALVILVATSLLVKPLVGTIFKWIGKVLPTQYAIWRDILKAFERPVVVAVFFSGLLLALHVAKFPGSVLNFANNVYRSALIFSIGLGLFNLMGGLAQLVRHFGSRLNLEFDQIVMPFLTRVLQFVVMALTVTMILSDWGFNINGVVAGLGLAGLAVSMAAQDYIRNLMGGITIITETPFSIGDWIATPSVEGITEDISFRTTKIRTFDGALVIVPNATLANEPITNWSKISTRKLSLQFFLDVKTPTEAISNAVAKLQALLDNDDRFETQSSQVFLSQITTFGEELTLWGFVPLKDDTNWFSLQDEINIKALRILKEEGIQLATPVAQTPTI